MSAPGAAGPGAKFPQWFVNTMTHTVSMVTSPETKAAAEAVSWPATLIFFTSQAAADNYLKANGGGGDISNSPVTKVANDGTDAAIKAVKGTASLTDFLGSLQNANTWIRVAKVVVGASLLIIGIAHMTGADNAVAQVARRAPLPI
jgi:hypothetical protein